MKLLLTGGHVSPLLAVLAELPKNVAPIVIGRKYTFENHKTESLEYELIHKFGVPFYDVGAGRLQRKMSRKTIPSLLKTPPAFLKARNLLKTEKPDVVLTFGGYIGFPVALAAYSLKIPVVLHEQTLSAGLTNKYLGKIAQKICISYPTSKKYFNPSKTILTGNPVRKEMVTVDKKINVPHGKLLYVTGGSAGAHPINEIVEKGLRVLLENFVVLHQTGDAQEFKDYERLGQLRKTLPDDLKKKYILRKFVLPNEIGWVYKTADVILSRSGINTVTELIALQKKAVLIPLPHGQKNEQLENAKYYESTKHGTYILQSEATPKKVLEKLLAAEKATIPNVKAQEANAASEIVAVVLKEAKHEQA